MADFRRISILRAEYVSFGRALIIGTSRVAPTIIADGIMEEAHRVKRILASFD
jgi:hypothetical protein